MSDLFDFFAPLLLVALGIAWGWLLRGMGNQLEQEQQRDEDLRGRVWEKSTPKKR